jgi:hypothetical protein
MGFFDEWGKTFQDPFGVLANVGTGGLYGVGSALAAKGGPFDFLPPAAPDYAGAAQAQAQSSQGAVNQQTQANRPNQSTPWASSQWGQNPDGSWSQNTGFSNPFMLGAQNALGQQMQDAFSAPAMTGDAARQQAIDAAYGQATSRLDPMWQQRESQARTRLLNQGLDESGEAFRNAMGELGRERTDAYTSAMNSAIGQGTQAGAATFAQNMAARNAPLQALQGLSGFLSMPGFQGAGAADPTQHLAAAMAQGNYGLGGQLLQNKGWADVMGGLFRLGGAGVG